MTKEQMKNFFNMIPVCGDGFRKGITELEKMKADKLKTDLADFIRDSDSWKKKNEDIETWYQSEREALGHKFTDELSDQIAAIRADIDKSISRLDVASVYQLASLQNVPITAKEMEILIQKYDAYNNYWNSKQLVALAEANGIVSDRESLRLMPTADTMYAVLDEIEADAIAMLSADYADPKYDDLDHLREKKSMEWEQRFSNSTFEQYYTKDDIAARLYTRLASTADVMEMGIRLKAVTMNCKDQGILDRVYARIADDDTRFETAIRLAGITDIIADFKSGKRQVRPEAEETEEAEV